MYSKSTYNSPLGEITLLSDGTFILGLWFSDQKYFGAKYDIERSNVTDDLPIEKAKTWLDQYFDHQTPDISSVPLHPEVTTFRNEVLNVLKTVPYGETITYQQIAQKVADLRQGKSSSARAVGGAVGHNPISIIIPCHRVIGTDGSLTGYAGGLDRKIALLDLEGANYAH